jgi:capsular exopolysaccharide synthesis family protein
MTDNKIFTLENLNIYSLLMDLVRRLWFVFIVVCIAIMGRYTYLKKNYVPEYSSTAIYVVTPKQSTGYVYTNRRFAESVITVFQNLMTADIMQSKLHSDLHISIIGGKTRVSLIEGTNLMKVEAVANDPIVAFQAIGAIMGNYDELSPYLSSDAVFDELRGAEVATQPNNTLAPQRESLKAGLWAGLIVSLIILAISFLRRTVKRESIIENEMDTTLLGTIYHENKNRTLKAKINKMVKALLITSPIISNKFIESVDNIRVKLEYENQRHPSRNVYMISSVCENEGKSTVAINVALSFAKEGKRVVVLDADFRKPAIYKMMDVPKGAVVDSAKLLQGQCGLDEVLYHDKKTNLDLILSSKGYSNTNEYMKSGAMRDLIRKCSRMADYVIIDTPPMALVSDAEALLDRVDFCMLVVRQDFSYQRDVVKCITIMNNSNAKMLGCILNDYKDLRTNLKPHTSAYGNSEGKVVEIYDNE